MNAQKGPLDESYVKIYDELMRCAHDALLGLTMLDTIVNFGPIKAEYDTTPPPPGLLPFFCKASLQLIVNNCEIMTSTTGGQYTLSSLIKAAYWLEKDERKSYKKIVIGIQSHAGAMNRIRNGFTAHRFQDTDIQASYALFKASDALMILRAAFKILLPLSPYPGWEHYDMAGEQERLRDSFQFMALSTYLSIRKPLQLRNTLMDLMREAGWENDNVPTGDAVASFSTRKKLPS